MDRPCTDKAEPWTDRAGLWTERAGLWTDRGGPWAHWTDMGGHVIVDHGRTCKAGVDHGQTAMDHKRASITQFIFMVYIIFMVFNLFFADSPRTLWTDKQAKGLGHN